MLHVTRCEIMCKQPHRGWQQGLASSTPLSDAESAPGRGWILWQLVEASPSRHELSIGGQGLPHFRWELVRRQN
jgi:hypothetical protein